MTKHYCQSHPERGWTESPCDLHHGGCIHLDLSIPGLCGATIRPGGMLLCEKHYREAELLEQEKESA